MRLRTDLSNWKPLTVPEVSSLFSGLPIYWGIVGGWALDLHLGRTTREHHDVDIVIFREDQQSVYEYLKSEWSLYKAKDGKLSLWLEGEYLETVNDIWVSRGKGSPWTFQIMLMDNNHDQWIYRREKSVRLPKTEIFSEDKNKVPYLKPQIQLLYKAGSSKVRAKDFNDFEAVLPSLSLNERAWLKRSLRRQFPSGHSWFEEL